MFLKMSFSMRFSILLIAIFAIHSRSAIADAEGERILQEVSAAYTKMQTLAADFAVRQEASGAPAMEMHGTIKAKKPDLYAIDSSGALPARMVSDGKTVLYHLKSQNAYARFPAGGQSMNLTVTAVAPLTLFFNTHKIVAPNTPTRYLGKERWSGQEYDCVEQRLDSMVMRYDIGKDRIVYRMQIHVEAKGQKMDVEASLCNVRIDPPLPPKDFEVTPPQGAQQFEMPVPGDHTLAPGAQAPDFTLPQPDGGKFALADLRKESKAVLITFWFYTCATCREEHPQLQKLYAELKAKGLGVVAVNSTDDRATIEKYMQKGGWTFPVCMDDDGTQHFGIAKEYGVDVYPTTYLLDKNGKIVLRTVGYDEAELRAALQKLGVK